MSRDYHYRHALHLAAGRRHLKIARSVLKRHPTAIDDRDRDGSTPLYWACRQEDKSLAKLLLDKGADKRARTDRDRMAIHVAIYHGCVKPVNLLETKDEDKIPLALQITPFTDVEEELPVKPATLALKLEGKIAICQSRFCVSGLSKTDTKLLNSTMTPRVCGPRYTYNDCIDLNQCFKCFQHVGYAHYRNRKVDK